MDHLRAIAFVLHVGGLSAAQRLALQKCIARLGPNGPDWPSALQREMKLLNWPPRQASVELVRVTQAYVAALHDSSTLPQLEDLMAGVPLALRDVIPAPRRVLEEKQELSDMIRQTRSLLQ